MTWMAVAMTVLRKELLEAIRDRRTVVLTLFVPLIFYPLMVGAFGFFTGKKQLDNQSRALTVHVVGEGVVADPVAHDLQRLAADDDVSFVREKPARKPTDATLNVTSTANGVAVVAEYLSTSEGRATRIRVDRSLRALAAEHEANRLAELGLDKSQVEPMTVEWRDVATPAIAHGREAAGMLVYFLLFLAFTACLSVAIDVGAGEKERGTMETLLTTPADRGALFAGKLVAVVVVGCSSVLFSAVGMGLVVLLGVRQSPQMAALAGDLLNWPALMIAVPMLFSGVLLLAASTLAVSLRADSAKQAQALIAPMLMAVVLTLIAAATPAVSLDITTVWVPILNLALAVRALITSEGAAMWMVAVSALITIAGIVVTVQLGARALKSERAVGR